ncbi:hypothetical protein [Chryseobacterium schmidteae]|uniref:hypothetical protein n=1 Tax=Chryseobacterium schmidteae TaxID=2730404 RepID=UPI00158BC63C|nr:hypothetical protein [Chryseobacterium schmidteae]
MRNKYYLLAIFCYLLTFSQSPSIQDNFLSAPSAASVPSYVKSPISISSGIPDTQIPFFNLPTHNKNISINTGISYHPNNTGRSSKASDLGLGWSIYGITNLIYQEVNPYNGDAEGDFYYSVMGQNGRFTLYDRPGNISIYKVTNDQLKITVTKVNGIYNFKIVDPLGTTYFLDVSDRLSRVNPGPARTFSTAYYLSRVVDVNNVEVLNYQYQEDAYTITSIYGLNYPIKSLKVKKIISLNFGEINLNYAFDDSQRKSYSDPFQLTSIELKNRTGTIIEKYGFQSTLWRFSYPEGYIPVPPTPCLYTEGQSKRILTKLLKYNKNSSAYQTTEFTYNSPSDIFQNEWSETYYPTKSCFENEPENPKYLAKALLKSVKFPNGTKVMYTYELNQYYVNKNTEFYKTHFAPAHEVKDREAQYFEDLAIVNFDTNHANNMLWKLPANPDSSDGSSYLQYWVNVDEYYDNPLLGENEEPIINVNIPPAQSGKHMSGYNSININGTGGRGTIVIQRVRYKSMPIANYSTGKGVRINKIEYYDSNTLIPSQTKRYEYQYFNNNAQTSGVISEFDNVSIVYKNVKETIGEGAGYTKYYFKALSDYPQNIDANGFIKYITELDYYDVLVNGIIAKKEIYTNDNTLLSKEEHDYELYQIAQVEAKAKSMVKKHFITGTAYAPTGFTTVSSESQIDTKDLNLIYTKTTESDGTVNERNITYAWGYQLTDPKLWTAGIIGLPIVSETKKNGTVISKSETKFENTANFYPTSQISFLPDNLSQSLKNVSYDVYDDKGNPVQFTAFPDAGSGGVPTTIIFGYNKTMPIAKVEGAKLSDIPADLITAIVTASDEDANATPAQEDAKEQALIAALNTFKNNPALQNFMVTCYTYNPLVGITTTIPPNGLMEMYKYDSFNRLLKVVDANGNTVKEHLYNYKN